MNGFRSPIHKTDLHLLLFILAMSLLHLNKLSTVFNFEFRENSVYLTGVDLYEAPSRVKKYFVS